MSPDSLTKEKLQHNIERLDLYLISLTKTHAVEFNGLTDAAKPKHA
jgi:hypothetical protein